MPGFIGLPELLLLGLLALVLFGPKRLPEMGRGLGKGLREFKESVSGDHPGEHGFDINKLVVIDEETQTPVAAEAVVVADPQTGNKETVVVPVEEVMVPARHKAA
jgi:sec-independent protein translocase protein TatA